MTETSAPMAFAAPAYDRLSELKAFDATKAGVKGLIDAGITAVPRIFHDPAAAAAEHESSSPGHEVAVSGSSRVPVIDLAAGAGARSDLVVQVKAAAETTGIFQVVNHGVPAELLAEMLSSIRRFHEEPVEAKARYYSRDVARRVRYQVNFDLYTSAAANWRDTLIMVSPAPEEVPPACRGVLPAYTREVKKLGATLFELLSEAMCLDPGYLQSDAGCMDLVSVAGHYYPPCPEPHLTMGTTRHSDPSFLTVLLQDNIGGLQVLIEDDDNNGSHSSRWMDVAPVAGALVVNVGDFLQLVSNDRFRSVEHRVRAAAAGPRVSVACFLRTDDSSKVYGPIVDASSDERPRYRSVTVPEYHGYYISKGLDGRSALDHIRLSDG